MHGSLPIKRSAILLKPCLSTLRKQAAETLKDSYVLDFLGIAKPYGRKNPRYAD